MVNKTEGLEVCGSDRMEENVMRVQAVAEGWAMKNIPRANGGLSCLIICFTAIAVVIIIAFLAGWFG